MGNSDNFCLRLNEFENNVTASWRELQQETDFCDVTLACEDKQLNAHKFVISSCSSVLRNILKQYQTPHPLIYLRKVTYRDLQNLLQFMYQGEVNVAEEDLSTFLEVGEDLNVRGLSEGNTSGCAPNFESFSDETLKNDTKFVQEFKLIDDSINNSQNKEIVLQTKNLKNIKQQHKEGNKQIIKSTFTGNHYSCEKCRKQFSRRNNLHQHNKEIHEGIKYSCDKCEYKATKKVNLIRHVQSIHNGE